MLSHPMQKTSQEGTADTPPHPTPPRLRAMSCARITLTRHPHPQRRVAAGCFALLCQCACTLMSVAYQMRMREIHENDAVCRCMAMWGHCEEETKNDSPLTTPLQTHLLRQMVQPCNHATMQPCNHATMQPCNHATMQPCNHATMQPCNHATMQPCNHATMQPCNHATTLCTQGPNHTPTTGQQHIHHAPPSHASHTHIEPNKRRQQPALTLEGCTRCMTAHPILPRCVSEKLVRTTLTRGGHCKVIQNTDVPAHTAPSQTQGQRHYIRGI